MDILDGFVTPSPMLSGVDLVTWFLLCLSLSVRGLHLCEAMEWACTKVC